MSYQIQARTVEAVRFMGDNAAEIETLAGEGVIESDPDNPRILVVVTPTGRAPAGVGDWMVRVAPGACYPLNPKAFAALQA